MEDFILVQHATGAPGLRIFGLGPKLMPIRAIEKLQVLLDENTSWANQRSKNDVKTMLSSSEAVVSVWKDTRLIGFGRATSDKVYRAVLWDIVVEKKHQKNGQPIRADGPKRHIIEKSGTPTSSPIIRSDRSTQAIRGSIVSRV